MTRIQIQRCTKKCIFWDILCVLCVFVVNDSVVAGGRRVRLWDGEQITGQILDITKDTVRLRTAWAARLELPRAAVASVDPLPGWRTVAEENFRAGAKELAHTLAKPLARVASASTFRNREQWSCCFGKAIARGA